MSSGTRDAGRRATIIQKTTTQGARIWAIPVFLHPPCQHPGKSAMQRHNEIGSGRCPHPFPHRGDANASTILRTSTRRRVYDARARRNCASKPGPCPHPAPVRSDNTRVDRVAALCCALLIKQEIGTLNATFHARCGCNFLWACQATFAIVVIPPVTAS